MIIVGKNVTAGHPGSAHGPYLIVSDVDAARVDLLGRGVEVSRRFRAAPVRPCRSLREPWLPHGSRGDWLEAAQLALSIGALAALAQGEEPGEPGGATRSARELGR
jgi:hypothetical protein